jgi:DNA end-binding protein Ku
MANTVWKGQLAFGLVSFPVRLVRAARKDRIPLRHVREIGPSDPQDEETNAFASRPRTQGTQSEEEDDSRGVSHQAGETIVAPVRQAYIADEEDTPTAAIELQRGYEVSPGQFAVVRSEELRRLRQPTSASMEIVRSVRMEEIDPVFLETSYYVLPGNGGEHSCGLFYRALKESGYAALGEVAMHGRQHVVVMRPGSKGLIAHTMYYVNEVRANEEHIAGGNDVSPKELDLAKRFVVAIAAPFQPEDFTDRYREQLESLIASTESVPSRGRQEASPPPASNVIDIMDALRKSLEKVAVQKTARKPVAPVAPSPKARKRRA